MNLTVDKMSYKHWPQVRNVYREGIETGNATFETEVPEWDKWNESHLAECRLVAEANGMVLGWAALSPVSERCVYAGVAEVSIYVAASARGQGVGTALLSKLIEESEHLGIWTLQAGIFPENKASIVLHQRAGFRQVGIRERLGQMHGVWRDVVLMERRSKTIGI